MQGTTEYMIPTTDGKTLLNTVVSTPENSNPSAVFDMVLERSPYGQPTFGVNRAFFNSIQYLYAGQDLRGTQQSTGEFQMWRTEFQDTKVTIEYLSKNVKGFSGNVFSVGYSANAISAYFQTKGKLDALKGQCLSLGTANAYKFVYQGGALRQYDLSGWLQIIQRPQAAQVVINNEMYSEFWDPVVLNSGDNVTFPSLHAAGWNDLFLDGSVSAFEMYRKKRPKDTFLIVYPTGHCQKSQISYPGYEILLHPEIYCPFLFKYGSLPLLDYVTLYLMGPDSVESGKMGNYYVSLPDFPATRPIQFVLSSNLRLQPVSNDDSMKYFGKPRTNEAPGRVTYVYNPINPTPTIGGNNLLIPTCGAYDQRENEKRLDNLVLTSDVFTEQMLIVGRMSVSFKVSSNCTDTDFVVRLSDVYPDGRSMLLSDSILRMRWRESSSKKSLMEPGKVYDISIDMWPTAYFFNPGHALRIAITSSNYPRFSANPNNGLNLNESGPNIVAANTVLFDDSAVLTLPLVKDPASVQKAKVDLKKFESFVKKH